MAIITIGEAAVQETIAEVILEEALEVIHRRDVSIALVKKTAGSGAHIMINFIVTVLVIVLTVMAEVIFRQVETLIHHAEIATPLVMFRLMANNTTDMEMVCVLNVVVQEYATAVTARVLNHNIYHRGDTPMIHGT